MIRHGRYIYRREKVVSIRMDDRIKLIMQCATQMFHWLLIELAFFVVVDGRNLDREKSE